MGNYYQVTKTPGGGYWVNETDAVGGAMTEGAALAGVAIGTAVFASVHAVGRFMHDRAWNAMERAADCEDWQLLHRLAGQFVRSHPEEPGGYEYQALAMSELERPTSEFLQLATTWKAHRGPEQGIVVIRAKGYLVSQDMANLLRESNTLVSFDGEFKVLGHMLRAKALMWLGDLDEALANASAAISLGPEASCYGTRAEVHWAIGDLTKAVSDYSRAVRLAPAEPSWLEKRASVYEAQGEATSAEADRQAASELRSQKKVAATQPVPAGACPNCGYSRTPPGKPSCFNCGSRLDGSAANSGVSIAPAEAAPVASASACPNCGYSRTPPGKPSCFNCGTRLV